MTSYLDEYHDIIADLAPADVAALWYSALYGRRIEPALRHRLCALVALRDRMGRASAMRRAVQPR